MFDQFYRQSSDELKLAFMQEAFQKYPHLQEDFIAFYFNPPGRDLKMTLEDPDVFIQVSADLIREEIESININEPDWEHYVPRHSGYIPEYEAMEHLAEDEISRIIGFHVSEVATYCEKKLFDLAFLYMISIYRACMEAELDDEYETLPDATYTMLNELERHLQDYNSPFKAINISEDQLFTIVSVLLDQSKEFYPDGPEFLTFFEPYLFSVIHSGTEATIALNVIEEKKLATSLPWLVSELHRKTGGQEAWERTAQQLFKKDKSIAGSLLEFYETDNKQEFARIAGELWYDGLFQGEFADLYFEVLEPEDSPDLYREITIFLNDQNFSQRYYQVLQTLMSIEERMSYIEKIKWDKSGYVRALCMEGKYVEALEYADEHINRWNIVDIITPCLQGYPDTALALLERKTDELLVAERGRNFYGRIAEALKIASEVPALHEEVKMLARRLYFGYSRLSALRGEILKTGLVKA